MNPLIKVHQEDDATRMTLRFTLNGETKAILVSPERRLVDLIRTDLNLTGTKISCEVGRCGACMVIVDGKPMNSCLLMAYQIEGRAIETIEGLTISDSRTQDLQDLFLEEGALQCGYCTPGMIVSLTGFLNGSQAPDYEDVKEALSGNLCRCTGYGGIHRVISRLTEDDEKKGCDRDV